MAPSSMQLYRRAWTLFRESLQHLHLSPSVQVVLPLSVNHIAIFVSHLYSQGYAPTSIISYSSAIGYVHRVSGWPDPSSDAVIQKLIAGAIKIRPPLPPRLPITLILLYRIMEGVDAIVPHYYHRLLLKSMFTVAFFGLMRMGEVTVSKHHQVSLFLSQITLSSTQIIISIKHFKHNSSLKPVDIPLLRQTNSQICPLYHMSQYLLVRGFQPGPLFAFPSNSPVPRAFFAKQLKLLLTFSGMDTSRYKGHSFRIGGASYLADMGYTDSQIRLIGRWETNAFIRYIRSTRALQHF